MKTETRIRRQARQNLEDLATRCLQSAVMVLMRDATFDADFNWAEAGRIAVLMAKEIRLSCARETADLGGEELAILAENVIEEAKGAPN